MRWIRWRTTKLRQLIVAGTLEKIYSHLLSLDNFRRLLNRRSFFAVVSADQTARPQLALSALRRLDQASSAIPARTIGTLNH